MYFTKNLLKTILTQKIYLFKNNLLDNTKNDLVFYFEYIIYNIYVMSKLSSEANKMIPY